MFMMMPLTVTLLSTDSRWKLPKLSCRRGSTIVRRDALALPQEPHRRGCPLLALLSIAIHVNSPKPLCSLERIHLEKL